MLKKVSLMCLLFIFIGRDAFVMAQPAPYSQLDPKPYNSEVDIDPDLFMSSWKESMPRHEHGSLIIRDIFTENPGDPLKPPKRGAILNHLIGYCHGTLEPHASTIPSTLKGEQKIFYIYSGRGAVKAGGKTAELRGGIGVLMPENLEFTMTNTGDKPMNMYIIVEPVPENFKPRKDMLVRDEKTIPISGSRIHWSNMDKRLFWYHDGDGTALIGGVAIVRLSPMTMAQPHASTPKEVDVLWIALEGDITSLLGKQLRKLPPGTAFANPGDGKFVHSNINVTDEIIKFMWVRTLSPKKNDLRWREEMKKPR